MPSWQPTAPEFPEQPAPQRKAARSASPPATPVPGAPLTVGPDPYLLWALMTKWRGQSLRPRGGRDADPKVQVLFGSDDLDAVQRLMSAPRKDPVAPGPTSLDLQVPHAYRQGVSPGSGHAAAPVRFGTGSVRASGLPDLVRAWPTVAFELAASQRSQVDARPGDAKAYYGQQTRLSIPPLKEVFDEGVVGQEPSRGSLGGGTMAVFDYGCPFLRGEFDQADGVSSRLRALWHQEPLDAGPYWARPSEMGYGRVMGREAIDSVLRQARGVAFAHDEARAYASLRYLVDLEDPRRRVHLATHGAHVLHMAGGWPDPWQPHALKRDAAADANLAFVNLPEDAARDCSGAALGACLLDAVHWLLWITDPAAPLVLNVSYGGTAGPHNGRSLVERALDELLYIRGPKTVIVLAAGNSRRLGLHCERRVLPDRSGLFRIDVAEGDRTETFVEFWYDDPDPTADQAALEWRIRRPDGDWSDWVASGADSEVQLKDGDGVVAALIHRRRVLLTGRSMALMALAPTEAPDDDDGVLAEPGLWEVEARAAGGHEVRIHAWVRRDDPRPFSGRPYTRFIGLGPADAEHTLSSLACGDHTLVVGGFRASDGREVDYSSAGPRPAPRAPLVYGACEQDSVDRGVRAAAVRSGELLLMNGTSVAAPVVARRVFNILMSAAPPATREALVARLRDEQDQDGALVMVDPPPG